jgi:hypothetical protein
MSTGLLNRGRRRDSSRGQFQPEPEPGTRNQESGIRREPLNALADEHRFLKPGKEARFLPGALSSGTGPYVRNPRSDALARLASPPQRLSARRRASPRSTAHKEPSVSGPLRAARGRPFPPALRGPQAHGRRIMHAAVSEPLRAPQDRRVLRLDRLPRSRSGRASLGSVAQSADAAASKAACWGCESPRDHSTRDVPPLRRGTSLAHGKPFGSVPLEPRLDPWRNR